MKVFRLGAYQPKFMAHSYEVGHKNNCVAIQTDNEKNLGEEPYLIYQRPWGDEEQQKMRKDGDLYYADVYTANPNFKYHILYKDTGKIDFKDGEEYRINPRQMQQKIAHVSRIMHRQPTILAIKDGKTIGKVLYKDDGFNECDELPEIDEPTILLVPHYSNNAGNPNIVGIIYTNFDSGAFDHITTQLRRRTDVCVAIFEPEIIDKIISMDGKNIELEVMDGAIKFNETDKTGSPRVYSTIEVPKLRYSNKILTSKEYSPDIIGAKAVNLRRLEVLKEQGKIDVIIPKSIALTNGYIQEIFDENPLQEEYFNKMRAKYICKEQAYIPYKEEYCKERIDNLIKVLFDKGIIANNDDEIMVRSSFNGEDLPNYSAAGIYRSISARPANRKDFYHSIVSVARSKWEDNAIFSRKMHNIPDDNIQCGILLQQRIMPDYKFTLYTDDEKGNLKIDLYSGLNYIYDNTVNPHTFTYNKKTGKLTYDSIQLANPVGKFNEDQELQWIEAVENDLSDNVYLFKQLKKVAQNAIVVEKEFGAPQDIEGGIKGDNIYFWQSRNIAD